MTTTEIFNLITHILLVGMCGCLFILFKVAIVNGMKFSGTLEKEVRNGIQVWYIQTPFKKILLSKIYDEFNPYTLHLQEGGYYKMGILDKENHFIIPLWSLFQTEFGYTPNIKNDKYLNSESLWKVLTK